MTWFKVDDNLALHPKVMEAGNEAMGLWVRAGSWCGAHLTDGYVPDHVVRLLGSRRQADRLASAGLWTRERDGWRFHDWLERQPSREDEEARRAEKAAAGRLGGMASGAARRAKRDASKGPKQRSSRFAGASNEIEPPTRPDPTRPLVPSEQDTAAAAAVGVPLPPQPVDNSNSPDLPTDVVILRTALETRKLIVRWDRLTADQLRQISELITRHGDERLVHAAMQAHRPDRPAAFAQAWIGVWHSLPDPGQRLAVVKAKCTEPGHEYENASHCRLCAAERKEKHA